MVTLVSPQRGRAKIATPPLGPRQKRIGAVLLTAAVVCLALNIYNEARGEPEEGQLAVAYVTINRAAGKRSKICDEVFRSKQFSWVGTPTCTWDLRLMRDAIRVARRALNEPDFTEGALWYHRYDVHPVWSRGIEPHFTLGNHVFFRSL